MEIGKSIKAIREKKGLTQKQLAEIAQVTDKAVSLWECGLRDPRMGAIQKIADYFKVPISQIIGEDQTHGFAAERNSVPIPIISTLPENLKNIPLDSLRGYEFIPVYCLKQGRHYLCFRIEDDSMLPVFCKNDIVLVLLYENPGSDTYALLRVDNEPACIKKVMLSQNRIEVVSENPYYPRRSFDNYDLSRVEIFGTVVRLMRNFKY